MFENFYSHPVIRQLAPNERWTISNDKKVPLDMYEYMVTKDTDDVHIWGLAYNRGHNPCVNLDTVIREIPNAVNNTYFLNYQVDNLVVMDIEPTCPEILKKEFLKLPYMYAETSMSGHGYHLVFPVPPCIANYPIAQKKLALKEEHGYYEVLLNHMITFTRNMLPERTTPPEMSIDVFNNIFELLASNAVESKTAAEIEIDMDFDVSTIFGYDHIMDTVSGFSYTKTPTDFNNDMSRYEYGFIASYYNHIKRIIFADETCKTHDYTDNELVWLTYTAIKDKLAWREKHDTVRNGMPWLLYLTENLISKDMSNI